MCLLKWSDMGRLNTLCMWITVWTCLTIWGHKSQKEVYTDDLSYGLSRLYSFAGLSLDIHGKREPRTKYFSQTYKEDVKPASQRWFHLPHRSLDYMYGRYFLE